MYRVNPFTHLVSSLLSAALGAAPIRCADDEFQQFFAPQGQNCGQYLQEFVLSAGGYVSNPEASGDELCGYCPMANTNDFLAGVSINYSNRWRDWGILCVFVVFNVGAAVFFYWLTRVPKGKKKVEKQTQAKISQ